MAMPPEVTGPTLGDHVTRIDHVVINVSDLERARAFYEGVSPLRVIARSSARAQRFAGLGIDRGEFEGYVLDDGLGGRPSAVHLVQWTTPAPVGKPYPVFWNVGLAKIGFVISDPAPKLAQLADLGLSPTNEVIARGYVTVADPDGSLVSFYTDTGSRQERLVQTNPSVSDVANSVRFYGEVLGLDHHLDVVPDRPLPASQGPGSDLSQWDSHLFAAWGDRRFNVDVSQYHYPPATPDTSTPYPEAHHLGIVRIAFEVRDIDAAYAALRAVEEAGEPLGIAGPPEEWDLGPELGSRKVVCFRDPDGIRLELHEQPPRPESSYLLHYEPAEDAGPGGPRTGL